MSGPTFPNVFIATPTHACKVYCAKRFVDAVLAHAPGAEFNVICNSREDAKADYGHPFVFYDHFAPRLDGSYFDNKEAVHRRIVVTANALRWQFLMGDHDLYLSLESDVILQADTLPRMIAAISDEFPVVYANCYRWPNGKPFLYGTSPGRTNKVTMGCTLMRRSVLERIEYRYDPDLLGAYPDAFFAADCNEAGIGMWYDPTIWVEHVEGGKGQRGWGDVPESEKWWRAKK